MPVFAEEFRRRMSAPVTWILWLGLFAYTAGTMLGGQTEQLAGGGVPHNGSFVIYYWCMYAGFWVAVLGPAMFAHPLLRDARVRILPLIAAKPISASSYFWGKYFACILAGIIVLFSIPVTITVLPAIVGVFRMHLTILPYTPWLHIGLATLVWVLPAVFIYGSLHFAFAALTGRVLLSYGFAVLSMAVFTMFFVSFQADSTHHFWIEVMDPMGKQTIDGQALYWTVPERATRLLEMTPALLLNRALYLGIAALVLTMSAVRFGFGRLLYARVRSERRSRAPETPTGPKGTVWFKASEVRVFGFWSAPRLALYLGWQNYRATWHGSIFRAVVAALVMIAVTAAWGAIAPTYNTPDHQLHPVAQYLLSVVQPQMFMILVMVMIYFAGEIVARDVDSRFGPLVDSTPTATTTLAAGRWLAILFLASTLCCLPAISVIIFQLLSGTIERVPVLFVRSAFLQTFPYLVAFGSLTFGIFGLGQNRLLAQGLPMVLLWTSVALHESGAVEQPMTLLGMPPDMLFADMGILDTSTQRHLLFDTYYLGLTGIVAGLGAMAWRRGAAKPLLRRLRIGAHPAVLGSILGLLLLAIGAGVAIHHALYVENDTQTVAQSYDDAADYEKRFGQIADHPQPTITRIDANIRVEPAIRRIDYRAAWHLANVSDRPINKVWVNLPEGSELKGYSIDGNASAQIFEDERQHIVEIGLPKTLPPKGEMEMVISTATQYRGFSTEGFNGLLERESGILTEADFPSIGYQPSRELALKAQRISHGLGSRRSIPADMLHFSSNSNAARADMRITVDAPASLVAEATGDKVSQSTKNGRAKTSYVSNQVPLRFIVVIGRLSSETTAGPVAVNYYPTHSSNVRTISAEAQRIVARFTSRFGATPFRTINIDEVGQFVKEDAPLGPSTAGNQIALPERAGWLHDVSHPQGRAYLEFTLGEQIAKVWWGGGLGSRAGPGAALLDIGVPILLGLETVATSEGERAAEDYARVLHDRYRLLVAKSDTPRSSILVSQDEDYAALQAGLELFDKRQELGKERFDAALDAFYGHHKGGAPANPEDLARALATAK